MILLFLSILFFVILFSAYSIGKFFVLKNNLSSFFMGFSLFIGLYSFLTRFMLEIGLQSQFFLVCSSIFCSIIFVISILIPVKYILFGSKKAFVIFILLVLFFIVLSLRYTLGEEMGDVVYIFNVIQKPLVSDYLNTYNLNTGYISNDILYTGTKEGIGYYFFFSTLSFIVNSVSDVINIIYIPPYLITTWVANILFYIFSSALIISVIERFDFIHKKEKFYLLFWLGIFIGSYYYNITYPLIVVTMAVLNIAYLALELSEYFYTFSRKGLIRVFILTFSLYAYGATGAMFLAISSFAIVVISLINKNKHAFIQIPFFLIPIILYIYAQELFVGYLSYILLFYIITLVLCIVAYNAEKIQRFIYKIFPLTLALLFIGILVYSFNAFAPNYIDNWSAFFKYQGQFDRTQDYFNLSKESLILHNIPHYILLIALIYNQRTRKVGQYILVMSIFFINPFVREFTIKFISRIDVYNRIFFLIFNVGTIGLGVVALLDIKVKSIRFGRIILLFITLMLVPQTIDQVTGFAYPTYEPDEQDYNPIYKMSNNQIEILEKMRQIVVIEKMNNPLIISQIWGTAYYAPEFVTLGYNVNQQRYGPTIIGKELYEIFYSLAIPGDIGPKLERETVVKTCDLLIERSIDFVIFDKKSQLYDSEIGDYMKTEWYIQDCADRVMQNDRYSLYRFYWR